jgi:radical SAM superfamily enzyme YgiQ (UPF0313 family)
MKLIDKKIQKVALVNPNFITKSITDKFTIPALGLESIAANILDLVQVKIIDGKVENLTLKEIIKEINEFEPNVVGISCCFTIGINFALKIAYESKKLGYITILGGWHPSFAHSEILKYPFVDIIVRGEGEVTFRELIKNKDLEEIKGISYKDNGSIINTLDRPLIKDLNKLPFPARKLRNSKTYFQIFQMPLDAIETSRGCPYKCTFCNIHLFYRGTYRTKNTDRIDVIKNNPNIIKKMSKAGFWLFFLGIESFNQKSLNDIQKNVHFRDIVEAIKILHDNDMLIIGSLLIGSSLDEEEKDIDLMIKIVKKLGIDFPIYSIMTPLPGTKFRDVLIEKDYLLSHNWSNYNFTTAVNRLNKLSKEKLEELLAKAYYYGYFNKGWKGTLIRLYKKKGIRFLLNSRKIFSIVKDLLNFFINIRRMKSNINS